MQALLLDTHVWLWLFLLHSTELDINTRDPADRMLVATALRYDLVLVTADTKLIEYANKNRAFSALDCRP